MNWQYVPDGPERGRECPKHFLSQNFLGKFEAGKSFQDFWDKFEAGKFLRF